MCLQTVQSFKPISYHMKEYIKRKSCADLSPVYTHDFIFPSTLEGHISEYLVSSRGFLALLFWTIGKKALRDTIGKQCSIWLSALCEAAANSSGSAIFVDGDDFRLRIVPQG